MMLTWKYTLPAFLVPFTFTLSPEGLGLLLQGSPTDAMWTIGTAVIGVTALAIGCGGWLTRKANLGERTGAILSGLLLFYPSSSAHIVGFILFGTVIALHLWRKP